MSTPPAQPLKTPVEIHAALVKLYRMAGATLTYDSKASVLYDDINRDLAVLRWRDLAGEVNVITAVTEHEAALLLASAFGWQGEDHQTPWGRYSTTVMSVALVVRNDKPAEVLTHHAGREAQQFIGAVRELLDAVRLEFGEPMSAADIVRFTAPVSPTEPEQAP
jgi:hypothetical protein